MAKFWKKQLAKDYLQDPQKSTTKMAAQPQDKNDAVANSGQLLQPARSLAQQFYPLIQITDSGLSLSALLTNGVGVVSASGSNPQYSPHGTAQGVFPSPANTTGAKPLTGQGAATGGDSQECSSGRAPGAFSRPANNTGPMPLYGQDPAGRRVDLPPHSAPGDDSQGYFDRVLSFLPNITGPEPLYGQDAVVVGGPWVLQSAPGIDTQGSSYGHSSRVSPYPEDARAGPSHGQDAAGPWVPHAEGILWAQRGSPLLGRNSEAYSDCPLDLSQRCSSSSISPLSSNQETMTEEAEEPAPKQPPKTITVARLKRPALSLPKKPKTASTENSQGPRQICAVCGDRATGFHYRAMSCEGCKGFFKRTVQKKKRGEEPLGACKYGNKCPIEKNKRKNCPHCRFQACLRAKMDPDSVLGDVDRLAANAKRKRNKELKERNKQFSDNLAENEEALYEEVIRLFQELKTQLMEEQRDPPIQDNGKVLDDVVRLCVNFAFKLLQRVPPEALNGAQLPEEFVRRKITTHADNMVMLAVLSTCQTRRTGSINGARVPSLRFMGKTVIEEEVRLFPTLERLCMPFFEALKTIPVEYVCGLEDNNLALMMAITFLQASKLFKFEEDEKSFVWEYDDLAARLLMILAKRTKNGRNGAQNKPYLKWICLQGLILPITRWRDDQASHFSYSTLASEVLDELLASRVP